MQELFGRPISEDTKLTARYVVVGSWNMAFGITIFTLTYLFVGSDKSYVLVAVIAHPISVVQAHYVQRKIVWKSNNNYFPELTRFAIVQTQGLISTLAMMSILIEYFKFEVISSQIISTVIITFITFLFMRYWTFSKRQISKDSPQDLSLRSKRMLTRLREYRRSNSVHTLPDRVAMFLNAISTKRKSQNIGHLSVAELNSQLGKNPVIVEVGSFNGKDTLRLARNFTNASVYGFEPVPELFSVAVRRCLKAKNVKMLQLAASNFNGWTSLNVSEGTSRASSSILDPNPVGKFFRGLTFDNQKRVLVATIKLSDWFDETGLEKIDLLWIDVQGAEGLVLQGLEEKLNLVKMIYSEINFEETYTGAILFEGVKIFLEERGFTLKQVWRDGPAGDALFIRN